MTVVDAHPQAVDLLLSLWPRSRSPKPPCPRKPLSGRPIVPLSLKVKPPITAPTGQSPGQALLPARQPAAKYPPTNLVWAILSTICCCLPAGIVAIIYSVKVSNKFSMGDFEGAERASETSAWWCIASIVLGIISLPLAYLLPLMVQS